MEMLVATMIAILGAFAIVRPKRRQPSSDHQANYWRELADEDVHWLPRADKLRRR